MTSTQKGGGGKGEGGGGEGVRGLKIVTCLQIILFSNNRSIVHVLQMEGVRDHKIGQFLWTS